MDKLNILFFVLCWIIPSQTSNIGNSSVIIDNVEHKSGYTFTEFRYFSKDPFERGKRFLIIKNSDHFEIVQL